MKPTPADWYDDPFVDRQQRYWDGHQWTDRTRSGATATLPWIDWVLLALVVVGAVGILANTQQPSWLVGLALAVAVGIAVAVVIRTHARQR